MTFDLCLLQATAYTMLLRCFLCKFMEKASFKTGFFLVCVQVQFVMIFTHQLQVLFRPSCQYPRVFVYWIAMHGFLFLFLFSDFYKAQYSKVGSRKPKLANGLCMVSLIFLYSSKANSISKSLDIHLKKSR